MLKFASTDPWSLAFALGLQGVFVALVPLSGEAPQIPKDLTNVVNPASQEVIIDLNVPAPPVIPVPPPVATPTPEPHPVSRSR